MAYFTQEQIDKAKEIDVLSYLQNKNPDELVYESRGTYHTRTHDSLKISNGKWFWFSRGIGGITALEYLIQVEEYSFTEAVEHLINQKGIEKKYIPKIQLTEKEMIKKLGRKLTVKECRENAGLTIEKMAKRMNISEVSYLTIEETGIFRNSIHMCYFSDLVDVSMSDIEHELKLLSLPIK